MFDSLLDVKEDMGSLYQDIEDLAETVVECAREINH